MKTVVQDRYHGWNEFGYDQMNGQAGRIRSARSKTSG